VAESPKSLMARLHRKLQAERASRVFARLADQLRLSGHVGDAVELCQKGLKHYPNYASGCVVLGHCYLDLGALDDAGEAFRRVLALDSEHILALNRLGDILFQQGKLEEASEHYQRALQLDPANSDIKTVVTKLEEQQREGSGVEPEPKPEQEPEPVPESQPADELEREIPLVTEVPVFGDQVVKPEESLAELLENEGSSVSPQEIEAQFSPEETELLRNQPEEDAGKGPPRGMATTTLAEIYFQQGLLDKAVETYQKVVRQRPEDQAARDRLKELKTLRSTKGRKGKRSAEKSVPDAEPSGDQQTDPSTAAGIQEEG
jgi:tetratricopeptide (TPR) repeat protein